MHKNDHWIVDLDGTLISGDCILPGALDFMRENGPRTVIVSNNSTDTAEEVARRLAGHGIEVDPGRILLAGMAAIDELQRTARPARVLMLAPARTRAYAKKRGMQLVERNADIVLVCRDTDFDYRKLQRAAVEVASGAELVAANPDFSHPDPRGAPVPEAGALLCAVEVCAGVKARRVIGKPSPHLFREALLRLGCEAREAVVIGDNPNTDIAGAAALGLRSILVGKHPDAVASTLAALAASQVRKESYAPPSCDCLGVE